jgi:hypothetical protein
MSNDDDDIEAQNIINAAKLFENQFDKRGASSDGIHSKEEAIEWFNKRYAIIKINGKFKILCENNEGIELMDRKDFISFHEDMRITVQEGDKTKMIALTDIWLKSEQHRKYDGIIFDPSRVGHSDKYNLWKGYKIIPRKGDCSIFYDYMKEVMCRNNENDFIFLLNLIYQMFQQPYAKPGIAVVIRGDEGVGKSFFIEKLGALMGEYYFKTSNPAYIFGDHNGQLKNKLLLHLEEAVWAGSKKDESLLKDLITGRTIEINDKFVPVYSVPNHLHLFISGNPDWLVSAGFKARRLFALHASTTHIRDTEFFKKLDDWFWSGGGAGTLLYDFMNNKVDVNLRLVPVTDELIEQKKQSLSGVAEWAMSIAETGNMPFGEMIDGELRVIKNLLYMDFCKSPIGKNFRLSERQFGIQFVKLLPEVIDGVAQMNSNGTVKTIIKVNHKCRGARGIRYDAYGIPSLSVYRSLMDFNLSGKTEWDDKSEWTILRPNTDDPDDIHGKRTF